MNIIVPTLKSLKKVGEDTAAPAIHMIQNLSGALKKGTTEFLEKWQEALAKEKSLLEDFTPKNDALNKLKKEFSKAPAKGPLGKHYEELVEKYRNDHKELQPLVESYEKLKGRRPDGYDPIPEEALKDVVAKAEKLRELEKTHDTNWAEAKANYDSSSGTKKEEWRVKAEALREPTHALLSAASLAGGESAINTPPALAVVPPDTPGKSLPKTKGGCPMAPARIEIQLPSSSATVSFDSHLMTSGGLYRAYTTPPVSTCQNSTYQLTVSWSPCFSTWNGQRRAWVCSPGSPINHSMTIQVLGRYRTSVHFF